MNEQIKQKAAELLAMVADALRARKHDVETNPADLHNPVKSHDERWIIKIDGDRVPLIIHEKMEGGYSVMYGRRSSGRLSVRCDWVWNMDLRDRGSSVHMPQKTFSWSKERASTHGFDIDKVATHLELWLKTERQANGKVALKKSMEKQWKVVADRLRERFPDQARFITSDAKGLHIELTLGERQAEDVLAALAGDSCRVCSVALEPREKPICEGCYAKGADDGSDL